MEGRSLSELKVADLRRELEKRQKDKAGVKQVLIDRLKEEDGHDPLTYRFGNELELQRTETEGTDASACCRVALCDVISVHSVNGDDADPAHLKDDSSVNRNEQLQSDPGSEEQVEHKKIAEDPVTYVVQVGDQEEDLDYDLKTEGETTVENSSAKDNSEKSQDASQKETDSAESTRSPGGCFGFLQMASAEDAAKAARHFDCSDYNGHKISVEATERKPPALTSKISDRPNPSRVKHPNASVKTESSRPRRRVPLSRASRRPRSRPWFARARAAAARALQLRRMAHRSLVVEARREPPRISRPPPRMNPRLLAYQSLKRASLLLAAARYGSSRSSHVREPAPPRYVGTMRSQPQFARPESEPIVRESPRLREPLPPPPSDRRRSLPSARPLDSHQRARAPRSPPEIQRPYGRPVLPHRPEGHPYERMDTSRSQLSANRHPPSPMSPPFGRVPEHYRSPYEASMERRPSPVRGYPSRPLPSPRRDYRDISRSPPRSRNMSLMRPYPDTSPQHDTRSLRSIRDRSPPTYNSNSGPRPKVVDYGHRSEPHENYPGWKNNSPRIQTPGHTWKPAGHSFVSNYGSRRY
ncbi:unnamed protein product [Echinostoma caproni]|uniref:SAP domain-containing protein n=1 Tax=Echinostoma caproni TaxID=27848 RepID=A0A182ZZI2_9TREM|nr:unnamed protein product [Echinostoma caproni]